MAKLGTEQQLNRTWADKWVCKAGDSWRRTIGTSCALMSSIGTPGRGRSGPGTRPSPLSNRFQWTSSSCTCLVSNPAVLKLRTQLPVSSLAITFVCKIWISLYLLSFPSSPIFFNCKRSSRSSRWLCAFFWLCFAWFSSFLLNFLFRLLPSLMMYTSGNTISIFPIMMVVMMAVRPFKTLLSMGATFKTLDADTGATSAFGQKGCCSIALTISA